MLKLLKIKLLGITNVNYDLKYMDSNLFFGKFTRKEVQDFFSWYLSKPFKNNGGLEILDYINIAIDRGLIPADEADEMLINSKFVSTLPMDLLEMELKWYDGSLSLLPKFTDFLINKMDGNNRAVLIRLFRSNDINDFLLDKILDKLMEHPIEDIIEPQGFNMDREEILVNKIARSKYTLDEIKRFIIESDIAIPLIVDLFGTLYIDKETEAEKNKVISTFIICANEMYSKKSSCNKLIDIGRRESIDGYEYFAREISKNPKYTQDIKNKIAEKIFVVGNTLFMLSWISYVESNKNYDMIDYLINSSVIKAVKVLTVVQEKYFEYAISKVLDKGFPFASEVLNIILENVSHYPIDKIDAILLLVLERYSEFKFDENKALALVKVGSIYTKFLLHNYRFSKEIRLEIYNHYRDNGREDLLALYSGYLITGEANRIVDSKDADIDLSRLRKNPSEM